MKFALLYCLIIFVVTGCGSTGKTSHHQKKDALPNVDEEFLALVQDFKRDASSVSYQKLWHTYIKSSQKDDSGTKQALYLLLEDQLNKGELTCQDIDFNELTLQNFWSIKPHITAQSCYEKTNDLSNAEYHGNAIEFLLSGILSSGNGKDEYSAYEIATWGDASDVVELAGYEVVDSYLELRHFGQALYFIYVVNDPETGFQTEVYFENSKFIHELMGVQYPFAGVDNQLETVLLDTLVETDTGAKIAKAALLSESGELEEANRLYLSAVNDESAVANFRVGMSCYQQKQAPLSKSECLSYLFQSAEMGYMNATIAIAFIYQEGLGVEADKQLASELMMSVQGSYEPGEAWFKLAQFYNELPVAEDNEHYIEYLEKAVDSGNLKAELTLILTLFSQLKDSDKAKISALFDRLENLAHKGLDTAQAAHAKLLITANKKGSKKWNEAESWIRRSAEQGNPIGNYMLGQAYQYGYFGDKDMLNAYAAYNEAALDYNPDAQLEVGLLNELGGVVEKNPNLAILWYLQCAKADNLNCLRNAGLFFYQGIVVDKNYDTAKKYFQYAANRGHKASLNSLAQLYQYGHGVEQNYETANALYEKACNKDYASGCNNLGHAYQKGTGLAQDYVKSFELYQRACYLGDDVGCSNLGFMYRNGLGVDQDIEKAKKLFIQACSQGANIGCSNYRSLL